VSYRTDSKTFFPVGSFLLISKLANTFRTSTFICVHNDMRASVRIESGII